MKRRHGVNQSRRQTEVLRGVGGAVKVLAGLAELGPQNAELILRQRENDADASTAARWKNSARDRVGGADRGAKAFEKVPAPHALMRDVDVVIGPGALSVEAQLLKTGQRGAAAGGDER